MQMIEAFMQFNGIVIQKIWWEMTIFHKVTLAVANICLVYVPRLLPKSSEEAKS